MLSSLNKCCVIDSSLINKFHQVKELNVRDDKKCLQNIKNIKLFKKKKKRLLEITLSQHKGCQLHLTENALQDILPPETSK